MRQIEGFSQVWSNSETNEALIEGLDGGGGGGTNLSCQLKFWPFVSSQLNLRPFVSCQLISC